MADITSSNVASAIIKWVAAEAVPALMSNLVMGNLVNRDYEPLVQKSGDTVNVPIPPTLVANNIAEGGTVQTQNPSLGNAQIVLSTHAESTFQIPDVTRALATPDLIKTYMQPALIAIATRIESDLLSLYPQFTTNSAVGTGGSALTEATIDTAETSLFNALVPQVAKKNLVVSPAAYSALRQIPRFTEKQIIGDPVNPTGVLGQLKGFDVYRSQNVVLTGSGPATTHNLAFARDAIGMAIRRLPLPLPGTGAIAEYAELGDFALRITMSYQPNTLAQQITVDTLYGVGVLRNGFAVQVNS